MSKYRLYVGSYTAKSAEQLGAGRGITVCDYHGGDTIDLVSVNTDCRDPSFLVVKGNMLYAAEELPESTLSAYAIADGKLQKKNTLPLKQKDTCHIQLTPDGKYLSAADYGSGSLGLIRLERDGGLGELTCLEVHRGSSVHPRQKAPRVHSTLNAPEGKHLLAADLGTDTVTVYALGDNGSLTERPEMGVRVPAGRGPRHMAFSPEGTRLFVVCELSSTLLVYAYDGSSGIGNLLEERELVPQAQRDANKAADIHFSPDGRYLYISVRGCDSIVMMPYEKGVLGEMKRFPSYGKSPRNFCVTEDGNYLITANELSGNIAVLPRDRETGMLGPCAAGMDIPRAVYVTSVKED